MTPTPSPTAQADSQPGDKDLVAVPRDLIGAACSAIDKKRDGARTLAELRRYTVGDLSAAITSAPQADSQPAATGRIAELEDALSSCLQLVNQLNEHHIPDGCSRLIRHIKDAAATVSKAQASAPADSVTAPADGANWQDISTAPKDGTRFVAVGNNYGLYSETQHTCIAQWFRGCWMEVSDWNEASELKYLTHWMPLPPIASEAKGAGHA